jgi:phosphoglycolate phosphatase-like HAD superfamily hydrolase
MKQRHVIWDWNGTLLDDYEITARIAIDSLAHLGRAGLTAQDIRHHHRRPLSEGFSNLLGRTVSDAELRLIGERYEAAYEPVMFDLPLARDAIEAIEIVEAHGSQSVLSMAPHEQVVALIGHHGLDARFVLVKGSSGARHHHKRDSLVAHCAELGVDPASAVLIGDTVDDFHAASSIGIRTVLVTTGMQTRQHLEETGAPVVDSLSEAAQLAVEGC